VFADGSNYEGTFQNNDIHGRGVYVCQLPTLDMVRQKAIRGRVGPQQDAWRRQDNLGRWYHLIRENKGRKYTGQYRQDQKHGFGVFEWGDGRKYKG
jgi:hypothetical protein